MKQNLTGLKGRKINNQKGKYKLNLLQISEINFLNVHNKIIHSLWIF